MQPDSQRAVNKPSHKGLIFGETKKASRQQRYSYMLGIFFDVLIVITNPGDYVKLATGISLHAMNNSIIYLNVFFIKSHIAF